MRAAERVTSARCGLFLGSGERAAQDDPLRRQLDNIDMYPASFADRRRRKGQRSELHTDLAAAGSKRPHIQMTYIYINTHIGARRSSNIWAMTKPLIKLLSLHSLRRVGSNQDQLKVSEKIEELKQTL